MNRICHITCHLIYIYAISNAIAAKHPTFTDLGPLGGPSPTNTPIRSSGAPINVKDDFGAKGDGVTDDADALTAAMLCGWSWNWNLNTEDRYRAVFIPPGTYLVRHPIPVPIYREVVGCARGTYGTTIKAASDFNTNWNVTYAECGIKSSGSSTKRISPAVIQSCSWAPDPTWQYRWPFNGWVLWSATSPHTNTQIGSFHNGMRLRDLKIDASNVLGLTGIAVETMAQHSIIDNVCIVNCSGPGLWLTGICTGMAVRDSSFWFCEGGGIRISSNPFFTAYTRNPGDGNVNGNTSGDMLFDKISGDRNSPALFWISQPANVTVNSLKYEHATRTTDSVILFSVDDVYRGRGVGMNGGARCAFTLIGGQCQNSLDTGPNAGQPVPRNFCHIMADSPNAREWPKPVVTIIGVHYLHPNILVDDGFQDWPGTGTYPAGRVRIFGFDAPEYRDKVHTQGTFTYCNDTNERPGSWVPENSMGGTTLWLPNGDSFHEQVSPQ